MKSVSFPADSISFFAALAEGIVLTTPELEGAKVVWVSPSFTRLTGYTADEALGRPLESFQGVGADPAASEQLHEDLATGRAASGQGWIQRKNGSAFLCRWRVDALTNARGERTHWMVVQHDVTDERGEETVPEHLGLALNAGGLATVVLDTHLRVAAMNAEALSLLGESALGATFLTTAFAPPLEAQRDELRLALLTERSHAVEFSVDRDDGVARVLEVRCSPLRWPGTQARAIVAIEDATDRRRIEQIAGGVSLSDNIGHAFAGIRHELGNPVNSLKSAVSLLRSEVSFMSAAQLASYLEAMENECSRMDFLLRSLRNFSSLDSVESHLLSVNELVESFERVEAGNARKRGLRFIVERSPAAEWVWADERALFQILLNLTTNAFDACEGLPEPAVTLRVTKDRGQVRFDVIDNGPGIPQPDRDKLLRPFFTTKRGGTGLGLAMSQRLVSRMCGVLSFHSEVGKGSTFSVSLLDNEPGSGEWSRQLLAGLGG
jgi:PAS domain S-box-containing protein